ncbi:hypothetical protein LZ496_01715 [Sphingomonas sp. NSE70-1]|uniref:Secreted protein n=1 Tax=Sphingomonas caseinilyticus TaxID=2908205 RepID=A0ABT0RR73_9SPHN|nr:hypothetical protein [Sphingomonas caseinilyticus]MCL6697504.1 hypothetical protein [Sphingomonas caseinilyticus]
MKIFRSIACLALATAMGSASAAASKDCLSEVEGAAVMAAVLPDLIDGLRDKCAAHLPAKAFLTSNADAMVGKFRVVADERWPTAKLAFARIAGQEDMADKLPDEYFKPMLGAMVGAELVKDVKADDCPAIDRVVENLSPLPAENVAALIGAILMLANDEKDQDNSLPMCKA